MIRFVFLFIFVIGPQNFGHSGELYSFKEVEWHGCYDGDTCTFTINGMHPLCGEEIRVRIRDIDSPEIRGGCEREKMLARQAKQAMNQMLRDASKIELRRAGRGKYFRIVAEVWADGRNVGHELVRMGLALDLTINSRDAVGNRQSAKNTATKNTATKIKATKNTAGKKKSTMKKAAKNKAAKKKATTNNAAKNSAEKNKSPEGKSFKSNSGKGRPSRSKFSRQQNFWCASDEGAADSGGYLGTDSKINSKIDSINAWDVNK